MSIKDYFSFTRGEKRGTVVLLLIIIALIIANFSVGIFKSDAQTDFSEFEAEIEAFEKGIATNNNTNETENFELFDFNPNTISDNKWKRLGFKPWQIKTINNYKAKGGYWRSKADVAKIYGLSENHFEQLKPFILLPNNYKRDSDSYPKNNTYQKSEEFRKIEYFNFNPNTISKEEWEKLGFKDWQIKTIFNYKSKGGSWESKTDVKKIYGLNEADYYKLEPYILLPDTTAKKQYPSNKKPARPSGGDYTKKININTADAKELTNLKGVFSEKYAAIIIKYRNNLGGFIKKEQLKEVWNMEIETYNGFINQIIIDNPAPKQLNINKSSANELKKHPYLNWNMANAIVKYKKSNGNYKTVDEIKKIHLINNETYRKIEPYLKVE